MRLLLRSGLQHPASAVAPRGHRSDDDEKPGKRNDVREGAKKGESRPTHRVGGTTIALMLVAAAIAAPAPPPIALLERFRLQVPDARSVADLQVCAPHRINRDGTRGTLMVAASRPQQPRGYHAVNFRDGTSVIAGGQPDTGAIGGFDTVIARSMDRRVESCPVVPKSKLDAAWAAIDAGSS